MDRVETGTVESLTLGYTVLRTYDNRRIVSPNSGIASQVVLNLSSVDLSLRCWCADAGVAAQSRPICPAS